MRIQSSIAVSSLQIVGKAAQQQRNLAQVICRERLAVNVEANSRPTVAALVVAVP
jgi:hypothetical protein